MADPIPHLQEADEPFLAQLVEPRLVSGRRRFDTGQGPNEARPSSVVHPVCYTVFHPLHLDRPWDTRLLDAEASYYEAVEPSTTRSFGALY